MNLQFGMTYRTSFVSRLPIGCWMLSFFLIFLAEVVQSERREISASSVSHLCDLAAEAAAKENGVPLDVLMAISRVETGRSGESGFQPWPWTVNMEGAGRWFETEDQARAHVFSHFKNGARSFDVGCFQINYKWHGAAFKSIDDMFDPELNAQYAAAFLNSLFLELGDWAAAAGAYHSRTPEFARTYTARFEQLRQALTKEVPNFSTNDARLAFGRRRNLDFASDTTRQPFVGQGVLRLGSLVPITQHDPKNIGAFYAKN